MMRSTKWAAVLGALAIGLLFGTTPNAVKAQGKHTTNASKGFYLKDGDRVVFYGDSITDQRLYSTFIESLSTLGSTLRILSKVSLNIPDESRIKPSFIWL